VVIAQAMGLGEARRAFPGYFDAQAAGRKFIGGRYLPISVSDVDFFPSHMSVSVYVIRDA
jgi:hypothetical protein